MNVDSMTVDSMTVDSMTVDMTVGSITVDSMNLDSMILDITIVDIINLLKTKRNLLYIRNQSVPRSKLSTTVIKTKQLMMYKAKVAV